MARPRPTRPPRRSHAERTATTRARVVDAVVASIAEVGFKRTTAVEITRRAGVTWGAVQHQFGGKDGILIAVLEDSFNRFAARLAEIPVEHLSLERRVERFAARALDHFTSRQHASAFEILLDHLRRRGAWAKNGASWQRAMSRAWDGAWQRFFGPWPLPPRRRAALQHYTIAVISGLATMRTLEGESSHRRDAELAFLRDTMVRELSANGVSGRGLRRTA